MFFVRLLRVFCLHHLWIWKNFRLKFPNVHYTLCFPNSINITHSFVTIGAGKSSNGQRFGQCQCWFECHCKQCDNNHYHNRSSTATNCFALYKWRKCYHCYNGSTATMVNHQLIAFFCIRLSFSTFFHHGSDLSSYNSIEFQPKIESYQKQNVFRFFSLLHSVCAIIRSFVLFRSVHSFYVFNSVTQVCIGRVFNWGLW